MAIVETRHAKGGTLILGGGFAGSYVGRLLGKRSATIVSEENFMLYTPMLPEAASGSLEPRHVVVPLRMMCPHSELILGRLTALDPEQRMATIEAGTETIAVRYEQAVLALGSFPRALPVPGLAEHGLGFKDLADAIYLRNHVLRQLEAAAAENDRQRAEAHLTFVFVGAGYAGVEALAELSDLVRDALRYSPQFQRPRLRWVLVDAAPKILPEIPTRLGEYAAKQLSGRGVEIHTSTTLASAGPGTVVLSGGERIATHTLVWTAGVRPNPILRELGLPVDERGAVRVDSLLRRRTRAERENARPPRPADIATRAPTGKTPREEPERRPEAVPLPHARPGGHARALQGDRARLRLAAARVHRLVRHADVPPLPIAALFEEAARRDRLDRRAPLPPGHRRARQARPSAKARG
jgi:NADH dehydrogenase FAD-containing subunit